MSIIIDSYPLQVVGVLGVPARAVVPGAPARAVSGFADWQLGTGFKKGVRCEE